MTLGEKVRAGFLWVGGARLLSQLMTWAITIVVIRLLSPEDYGLLAMATVFVGFLTLLSEAGLGASLVQAGELAEDALRAMFGAVIAVNLACAMFLLSTAPLVAWFFAEPRLTDIVRVMALHFIFAMFSVIPRSLLARNLNFKLQSTAGLIATACGSLTTLALALSGKGVWALVIGNLVTPLVATVVLNMLAPYIRVPSFSIGGIRRLLVFGSQVTAARVLWFFYSQADVLIAGKLLGKDALGLYSVAMHLSSLPVQRISALINEVAFPAFARSQDQKEKVTAYILKAVRLMSFVSFPVLWGISSVAPEFVEVFLGERWLEALLPIQILSFVMPLVIVSPFFNTALQGIGFSGVVFRNVLTACIVMPIAFALGSTGNVVGISLAWAIAFPIVLGINMRRMTPLVNLRIRDVARSATPAFQSAAIMYVAVAAGRYATKDVITTSALLAVLIALGAGAYLLSSWYLNRPVIFELWGLAFGRAGKR